ncbi:MAG: GlxA family transcriptional regulator [Qingshengfaniella sp.]
MTSLGFLLFPGFPMACLTSAIEPLRAANEIAGARVFSWRLMSETGARVMSSAEVGFEVNGALGVEDRPDYLILLSGPLARFAQPRASDGVLRQLARHGVILGGVSGGVFPLARSGVMAGHRCSVHWCYEAAFRAEFPEIPAEDDVIIMDRRRYTASGAAAMFDLMLHLIERRLGSDVATEVACWFQHPLVRGEGVSQKIPAQSAATDDMLPPALARAVAIFADHIEDPVSMSAVAEAVNMSPRHLERSFKRATGQSPTRYYRMMRMKAARQLAMYSKMSMQEIALAVGYASAAPMVQHYRDAFGITPREDRERINLFRVRENGPIPSVRAG